jgi:hypothetical protein
MKCFTTADIRNWGPCYDPSRYLAETWQGTALDILNDKRIPFKDRLWVILRTDLVSEKLMRRFAVWCARQVQHLMVDKRSLYALDVAEAYAENRWLVDDADYVKAWEDELDAARDAAEAAARAAASAASQAAARAAAWNAADAAARAAAWYAADAAARAVAWDAAEAVAPGVVAWDAARDAAWAAARAAASAAARVVKQDAQERKLREMLIEGIETGDTK